MKIHELSCGTFCPRSERLVNGRGGWLASGHLVCRCWLIETRNGLVLVDTGLGERDLADPRGRIGPTWSALMRPQADPAQSARQQIEALGYYHDDVRHIVLTHLDFDHAGGLVDFPDAEVHVFAPEHAIAMNPRTAKDRFRYKPEHWAHNPIWRRYETKGDRWLGFDSVRALGDEETEILLVPLVGHTVGHCGVAVRTPEGWALHAGDAYFARSELLTAGRHAPPVVKLYERTMQMERANRVRNQQRLAELIRDHPTDVRVVSSHDPDEATVVAAATMGGVERAARR